MQHRGPTQSVCVADCYFIVNVLDLPFASPIAIYRVASVAKLQFLVDKTNFR